MGIGFLKIKGQAALGSKVLIQLDRGDLRRAAGVVGTCIIVGNQPFVEIPSLRLRYQSQDFDGDGVETAERKLVAHERIAGRFGASNYLRVRIENRTALHRAIFSVQGVTARRRDQAVFGGEQAAEITVSIGVNGYAGVGNNRVRLFKNLEAKEEECLVCAIVHLGNPDRPAERPAKVVLADLAAEAGIRLVGV